MSKNVKRMKVWVDRVHVGWLTYEDPGYSETGDYPIPDFSESYGGVLKCEFQYIPSTPKHLVVSLSMPVQKTPYLSSKGLHPVFRQNVPEGAVRGLLNMRYARKGVKLNDIELLHIIGRHQIGRVSITSDDVDEIGESPLSRVSINEVTASTDGNEMFEKLLNESYVTESVSGNHHKVAKRLAQKFIQTSKRTLVSENMIVKYSPDEWFPFLCANEYLCARAAWRAGINVAPIYPSRDLKLNAIKRFDRVPSKNSNEFDRRIGFDDALTLMPWVKRGLFGEHPKYNSSYEELADTILRYAPNSKLALFKRIAFSIAVRDGDAHLKNFGIVYTSPENAKLSPAYDICMSCIYKPKSRTDPTPDPWGETMALTMNDSREWPDREALIEFGVKHCLLNKNDAAKALNDIGASIRFMINEDIMFVFSKLGDIPGVGDQWIETGEAMTEAFKLFCDSNIGNSKKVR